MNITKSSSSSRITNLLINLILRRNTSRIVVVKVKFVCLNLCLPLGGIDHPPKSYSLDRLTARNSSKSNQFELSSCNCYSEFLLKEIFVVVDRVHAIRRDFQ